jgi:hypothetical protein
MVPGGGVDQRNEINRDAKRVTRDTMQDQHVKLNAKTSREIFRS